MPVAQSGYLMSEPSWDLRIVVPDHHVERILRVRGDMNIGGVMLKLVEELDISIDWSDYALWWPKKNRWLDKTRQTLDHNGVSAASILNFTPMHKPLRVQLPDLGFVYARVDFSVDCFTAVKTLCKHLGIRHSEELSFQRPLSQEHLNNNFQNVDVTPMQRCYSQGQVIAQTASNIYSSIRSSTTDTITSSSYMTGQYGTIDVHSNSSDINSTLSICASSRGLTMTTYSTTKLANGLKNLDLIDSPHSPSSNAKASLVHPKNLTQKARLNSSWLDSHQSLYQQNVRDYDTLQLKFKYNKFFDLNPRLDVARINQIYEQAKWSLLTGEVECTDDELMMFRALEYQIQQQVRDTIPEDFDNIDDNIDAALTELELQLEGSTTDSKMISNRDTQLYYQPSRLRIDDKSAATRILEAHSNFKNLSVTECQLNYIRAWEALPNYGIHTFVVKFGGSNQEEILGIAPDRLIRIDPVKGEHLGVWLFDRMETWTVNWDSGQVLIRSDDGDIEFSCLSANCKITHEFIGGYVFLSMLSKENNQILDEDLFYKLTKGWED